MIKLTFSIKPVLFKNFWDRFKPFFWSVFEIGLIFFLFAVFGSWPVPDVNEPYYVLKAYHFWHPDFLVSDAFLDTSDSHWFYCWTFGLLSFVLNPYWMAWAGRLIVWGLTAWSWQRLSFSLIPRRFASVISALALLFYLNQFHMAGEWLIGGVEGKGFAFPFLFFGLARMVKGDWKTVWIFLGAASAFHVLVGGWGVIAVLLAWTFVFWTAPLSRTPGNFVSENEQRKLGTFKNKAKKFSADSSDALSATFKKKILYNLFLFFQIVFCQILIRIRAQIRSFVRMFPFLLIGGLISLLGIIPALKLDAGTVPTVIQEAHRIYVFERLPHHLLPWSLPWMFPVRFLLLTFFWIFLCRFGRFSFLHSLPEFDLNNSGNRHLNSEITQNQEENPFFSSRLPMQNDFSSSPLSSKQQIADKKNGSRSSSAFFADKQKNFSKRHSSSNIRERKQENSLLEPVRSPLKNQMPHQVFEFQEDIRIRENPELAEKEESEKFFFLSEGAERQLSENTALKYETEIEIDSDKKNKTVLTENIAQNFVPTRTEQNSAPKNGVYSLMDANLRGRQHEQLIIGRKYFDAFVFGALTIALIGFLIGFIFRSHELFCADLLRFYWFRLSDLAVPMGVSLGGTFLLFQVLTLVFRFKIPTNNVSHWLGFLLFWFLGSLFLFGLFKAVFFHLYLQSLQSEPLPNQSMIVLKPFSEVPYLAALTVLGFSLFLPCIFLNLSHRISRRFHRQSSDLLESEGQNEFFAIQLIRRGKRSVFLWSGLLVFSLTVVLGGSLFQFSKIVDARTVPTIPRSNPPKRSISDGWIDVCRWVSDSKNTPENAVFLVPRTSETFKWYAQRSDVGVWKESPQDAVSIVEWYQKMEELYTKKGDQSVLRWNYPLIHMMIIKGNKEMLRLSEQFGFDYIIAEVPYGLSGNAEAEKRYQDFLKKYQVYRNGQFVVLRFPSGQKKCEEAGILPSSDISPPKNPKD